MPALVLLWLGGCYTGLPRPDPADADTDIVTHTDDTDLQVPRRPQLRAEISYPAHGDTFEVDETVYLEGEASLDGEPISVAQFRWTSSVDGFLGEDAELPWRPSSTGWHVIELQVQVGGTDDHDQIDVLVEPWR